MTPIVFTEDEQEIFDGLPGPPMRASIKSTSVWIIEWLPPADQRTGLYLHKWIQKKRPKWSHYSECSGKKEVLSSIERATILAKKNNMIPVLHIEAHGDQDGLGCPDGNGRIELLSWDELTEPLQELNLATGCNLIFVVAACIGFAGIQALVRGPRAPAIAIFGPDAEIEGGRLLEGIKEFYRCWMDDSPNLNDIVNSVSRETGSAQFDWEPFSILAYDALAANLIVSMRKNEQYMQKCRICHLMLNHTSWPAKEIKDKFPPLSPLFQKPLVQKMWDKMFMIDLFPENEHRFGVNWSDIIDMIIKGNTSPTTDNDN